MSRKTLGRLVFHLSTDERISMVIKREYEQTYHDVALQYHIKHGNFNTLIRVLKQCSVVGIDDTVTIENRKKFYNTVEHITIFEVKTYYNIYGNNWGPHLWDYLYATVIVDDPDMEICCNIYLYETDKKATYTYHTYMDEDIDITDMDAMGIYSDDEDYDDHVKAYVTKK